MGRLLCCCTTQQRTPHLACFKWRATRCRQRKQQHSPPARRPAGCPHPFQASWTQCRPCSSETGCCSRTWMPCSPGMPICSAAMRRRHAPCWSPSSSWRLQPSSMPRCRPRRPSYSTRRRRPRCVDWGERSVGKAAADPPAHTVRELRLLVLACIAIPQPNTCIVVSSAVQAG